ncbi:DUF1444 domain-containing protein [Bacillus aquiflavi]|uniref:UPF0354 protein G4D64_10755 n=1 Tax=Bacillus aquiflavi TaxID=2672567 RepID=A0A6B3W067_9BACI|nr:DUF1444 domain-containing protein [Bacillus aquiflavi]MBA4537708.1 DUF1444 domain-containing protein [Bacillus aquiflavi]NEY81965.1 DUF1444 domain-containing protein [Bacillus aquiflavi]
MDNNKMRRQLEKRLAHPNRVISYDREQDELRIESKETGKGVTISIPNITAKWHELNEKAIEEVIYYVEQGLEAMKEPLHFAGKERSIFPVIRSTSFPKEARDDVSFLFDDHTAETRIYYALDLGNTYRLIDMEMVKQENWDVERIRETALFNVRSLPTELKEDHVANNIFYFLNTNDGYDASRILNESFLKKMKEKVKGTMAIAVPHQDVFIIADIRNDIGYDVLAQMAMSFFANGRVPITALSFLYEDDELEPIFILGKNRKR